MALDTNDKTSNANNLTNNGSVAESNDTPFAGSSKSASFSGSNYLSISDASQTGLDLNSDFTFEAWIKPTALSGWQAIFGRDQENNRQYWFSLNGTVLYIWVFSTGSTNSRFHYDLGNVAGAWTHVAVAFDLSVPSAQFYVNGSAVTGSMDDTSATSIYNGAADFDIGTRNYFGNSPGESYITGLIDEVRVWSDIRTGTEISNNYQVELVGNEANLVAYYPFETLGGTVSAPPSVSLKSLMGVGK